MNDLHGIVAGIIVNIIFWGGWLLLGFLVIMSFISLFTFNLGGLFISFISLIVVAYAMRGFLGLLSQASNEVNQER